MLKLENISKKYGDTEVVSGVNLEVEKGEAFGFLGVNGAGKTTTMKMIVGLIEPTAGTIRLDGGPMDKAARNNIGFMPEGPYFYENLTGLEFLEFCGGLFDRRVSDKDNCRKILENVGLASATDKRIRAYSKGMRQRLGFAQAMVNNPDYIFLDEPLDGLDPIGRREIKEMLMSMKKAGKTIFLNSHILSDIEEICDSIGIINAGRVIYNGSVDQFCRGLPLEKQFVTVISELKQ